MNRIETPQKLGTFKTDSRLPYVKLGWESARMGLPFDYSVADNARREDYGQAYEDVRLWVLALKDNGYDVPKWRGKNVSPDVSAAIEVAKRLNARSRENGTCYRPIGKPGWQPAA